VPRIHIVGASGSGTTTLGVALARELQVPHEDGDDMFWLPTEPPFTTVRPLEERLRLLRARLPVEGSWVFSGSAAWAAPVEPSYDLIVLLHIDRAVRMQRLHLREQRDYGDRIAPGGDMFEENLRFLAWAEAYDTAGLDQRSRATHEAWAAKQTAPILELDSGQPTAQLVAAVLVLLTKLGVGHRSGVE
jgi:adenylate kinase family enzyme